MSVLCRLLTHRAEEWRSVVLDTLGNRVSTTCSLSFSGLHHEGFGQFLTEATLGVDQDTKGNVSAMEQVGFDDSVF